MYFMCERKRGKSTPRNRLLISCRNIDSSNVNSIFLLQFFWISCVTVAACCKQSGSCYGEDGVAPETHYDTLFASLSSLQVLIMATDGAAGGSCGAGVRHVTPAAA